MTKDQLREWIEHPVTSLLFSVLHKRRDDLTNQVFMIQAHDDHATAKLVSEVKAVRMLVEDLTEFEGLKYLLEDKVEIV